MDYFKGDFHHNPPDTNDKLAACKDMLAWASVLGRLAHDFPQIVGVNIDDFSDSLDRAFNSDNIAEIESRIRSQAPWVNFVPTVYHGYFDRHSGNWADLALTLDSMEFYFRNEGHGVLCIADTPECERTVNNAPDEIRDMLSLMPSGRKLQIGMYFVACDVCAKASRNNDQPGEPYTAPTIRYNYDLARLGLNMPGVGGVTAYGLQCPGKPSPEDSGNYPDCGDLASQLVCTDSNFLNHRYCALQQAYGERPVSVMDTDLTQTICASHPCPPAAAGNPFAFLSAWAPTVGSRVRRVLPEVPLITVHNVVFRGMDGHVHRFWRNSQGVGDDDLSAYVGGPNAVGDPKAYFFPAQRLHNIIYRGTDGDIHRVFWAQDAPARSDNLSKRARALDPGHVPAAKGDPFGYVIESQAVHNVVFAGAGDGGLHGLWFSNDQDPVHNDLLSKWSGAPGAISDPVGYVANALNSQAIVYVGSDGNLHRLSWPLGAGQVIDENLTKSHGTPAPYGVPAAYFDEPGKFNHVFYRGKDRDFRYNARGGDVFELWGATDPVNRDVLSDVANSALAQSGVSAYFVPSDRSNHVLYQSGGYVHELWWKEGASGATHNNLSAFAGAPMAQGDPTGYFDPSDGTNHAIYRTSDGHLHELRWND